jgi:hypothetical protein
LPDLVRLGTAAVPSKPQNVEAGARAVTIAVTTKETRADGVISRSREPGCTPNRLAVWVVTATGSAPPGAGPAVYRPATTWVYRASWSRYSTSIRGGTPAFALGAAPEATVNAFVASPAQFPARAPEPVGSPAAPKPRASAAAALASCGLVSTAAPLPSWPVKVPPSASA